MGDGGTITRSAGTIARCPECGYSEVVDDRSMWSPRGLSGDWCGHDREAFQQFDYELRNRGIA